MKAIILKFYIHETVPGAGASAVPSALESTVVNKSGPQYRSNVGMVVSPNPVGMRM